MRRIRVTPCLLLFATLCACASGPDIERLDAIRQLEATRSGVDALCAATTDPDRDVRRAACLALGQFADAAAQPSLAHAVLDADPGVAHAAVFALGAIRGAGPCAELTGMLAHADIGMRVIAAQALGRRLETTATESLLKLAHDDPSPLVRGAAATAIAALGSARGGTRALDDTVRTRAATAIGACLDVETDPLARTRFAYALDELQDPAGDDAAARALATKPESGASIDQLFGRVFALRALAATGHLRGAALHAALVDEDPRLQIAALGVLRRGIPKGSDGIPGTLRALIAGSDSPAVRAAAIDVCAEHAPEVLEGMLTPLGTDPSRSARHAAWRAQARIAPSQAVATLDEALHSADPFDRTAAIAAIALLPPADAGPRLLAGLDDGTGTVRAAVLTALASRPDAIDLDARLQALASDRDLAVREEFANLLLALPASPMRARIARETFADRPDAEHAEARKLLLQAVVHADPDAADLDILLREACRDPDLGVRLEAGRILQGRGITDVAVDAVDHHIFPRVGAEVPMDFLLTRPRIAMRTDKGEFVIALAPTLAPVHCWNLVQLTRAGKLDGRAFHRVVSNFVVQGGDLRDDGYGNVSWLGGTLRRESNPLPFLAGTLGMPRTAEPDSGGGQLFVTLGPTPWLDGAYTAFGRITSGLSVVERIEVGDRIVTARLLER